MCTRLVDAYVLLFKDHTEKVQEEIVWNQNLSSNRRALWDVLTKLQK